MLVSVTEDAVVLDEVEDTGRFHVVTTLDDTATGRTLQQHGAGRLVDGTAQIAVAFVRAACGERTVDAGWRERFEGMLDYARAKGWLTAEGDIVAHVVRQQA